MAAILRIQWHYDAAQFQAMLVMTGLIVGSIAALVSSWFLQSMLFGVRWGDPMTFIGIGFLLAGVSALPCYVPRAAPHASILSSRSGTNNSR
jgi:hypothetical protein